MAVALSLGLAANAHATLIPDQVFETPNFTHFFVGDGITFQQGVTAGQSGLLSQVDVFYAGNSSQPPQGPPAEILFFVNLGAPWQDDANSFEQTLTFNAGQAADRVMIDVSSANLMMQPGDQFVIGLMNVSPGSGVVPEFTGSVSGNEYPGGTLWYQATGTGPMQLPVTDLNFVTYVQQSVPIPEPSALLLLALAVAGLKVSRLARTSRPAV